MQQLSDIETDYFSDLKNWMSGPSFHVVFLHEKNASVGKFANSLFSDKSILPWNYETGVRAQQMSRCLIVDPILTHPIGAKVFERKYETFFLSYISIPPNHVGRICGQEWVYEQYNLDQMVALHTVLINLACKIRQAHRFSTVVLMNEAWSWPAKTENLGEGILMNHQIALHGGWAIKTVLPTNYALIPFSNGKF